MPAGVPHGPGTHAGTPPFCTILNICPTPRPRPPFASAICGRRTRTWSPWPRSRSAVGRVLRPARAQRRRQDHHHRNLRGPHRRRFGRRRGARHALGRATPRELRQRLGIQLQETQLSEKLTVLETVRLFRSFFRRGPEPAEVIALVQLEREAELARGQPLRRAEAAPGAGLRAGGRSGFSVPRRAHHGPRSAGPAPALGLDRTVQAGRAGPFC